MLGRLHSEHSVSVMTVEVQDVDRILLVPKSHKIGQKRGGNGAYRVERWRKKVQYVLK